MGCGSSKNKINVTSVTVEPRSPGSGPASPLKRPTSKSKLTSDIEGNNNTDVPPLKLNKRRTRRNKTQNQESGDAWGSQGSLQSSSSDSLGGTNRGSSATSKGSQHSSDSGFDDKDEYANVLTEESDPDRVREVEEQFESPRNLDLGLVGKACPQRYSAKDKERMQEKLVIDNLRNEGLIQRPVSRAANGLSFDLVSGNMDMFAADSARRPPARLAKLEKRRKKKRTLTESELAAKLEQADERRKELEHARIERIQQVAYKSDVQNAMDSFENRQKDIVNQQQTKEQLAIENREKKLREMRDKLKAKQEHAERVRRRKLAAPLEGDDQPVQSNEALSATTESV